MGNSQMPAAQWAIGNACGAIGNRQFFISLIANCPLLNHSNHEKTTNMRPTSATPWALLLLFALGTTLFTCCDDEIACSDETNYLCPNYDPCWNRRTPVSAAFRFGYYLTDVVAEFNINKPDVLPADYFWEANDTVLVGGLTFEAFDTTAHSYTWTVGTDSRTWNTRRFSLSFDCEDVAGQTIPIRVCLNFPD